MSSQDALGQANAAPKGAGIQIDLTPVTAAKDAAGNVTYAIGGTEGVDHRAETDGSGTFTIRYVVGRAEVGAVVAKLGDSGVTRAADGGATTGTPAEAGSTSGFAGRWFRRTSVLKPLLSRSPREPSHRTDPSPRPAAPGTSSGPGVSPSPRFDLGRVADRYSSEWLYAALALAGLAVAGGGLFFNRFATSS